MDQGSRQHGVEVRILLAGSSRGGGAVRGQWAWYRPIGAHRRERLAREAKQRALRARAERAAAMDAKQGRLL